MSVEDRPNEGNLAYARRSRQPFRYTTSDRFLHVYPEGQTVRRGADEEQEQERVIGCWARRLYYAGQQYDGTNAEAEAECGGPLPEHRRLHAYSTQIQECVDFLSNRLGSKFQMTAHSDDVQKVIDAVTADNDVVSSMSEDGSPTIVIDSLLRDALMCGDVPVYIGWDHGEQRPYWQFWESERVTFVIEDTLDPVAVVRVETVWADDGTGTMREVQEQAVYQMLPHDEVDPVTGESTPGPMEACVTIWHDREQEPVMGPTWLGIGRLPWVLLRGDKKSLRGLRGEPLITQQAMETADRYNAVEQTGYLISRYNSHSNVAVIGDAASLKLETDGRVSKDVADVLSFPGGTALQVLSLPTDPQMIQEQQEVLANALYSAFGVTRSDPSTINGLGNVSGYALEILNQKTEATYDRLVRQWRKDMVALVDATLDITAWQTRGQSDPDPTDLYDTDWWEVTPATVFSDRRVAVRLGSAGVVDDAKIRDDFVSKLISRQEALRQKGYEPDQIKAIEKEIDEATPKVTTPESGGYQIATPVVNGNTQTRSQVGQVLNQSQLDPQKR